MRIVRFIRKSVQFRHYPRKPKRDLVLKFDIFCLAIVLLKYLFTVLFVLSIGSDKPSIMFYIGPQLKSTPGIFPRKIL